MFSREHENMDGVTNRLLTMIIVDKVSLIK